jgi:hypothetical protein
MQEALAAAGPDGDLVTVLTAAGVAGAEEIAAWVERPATATAGEMVDLVVTRGAP